MEICNKQYYKLSGAQYAQTKDHINYLVLSRLETQQYYMWLSMERGEA